MKKLLLMAGALLMLCSCSTYYYSTLSSTEGLVEKDDFGDFIYENDSVKVVYSFFGYNLPIKILVINNSNQPLYVDWQRSALILDDMATNYKQNKVTFDGNIETNTLNFNRNFSTSEGAYSGTLNLPDGVSFIPPQSRIEHVPMTMGDFAFDKIPEKSFTRQSFARNNLSPTKVKTMHFAEFNSPLRFRSYLTLYYGSLDPEKSKPFVLDQNFYISEVMKSGEIKPEEVFGYTNERGDFFYYKKVKGTAFENVIGTIVLCTLSVVLEASLSTEEE